MTEIRINNPVRDAFAMVPNALWQWPGLSFKAKGLMAYLLQFRTGVCPAVAGIDAETGLSRDARRSALAELVAAGLAAWVTERDARGQVVAKFLEVTTLPLLRASVDGIHKTGNQSHGETGPAEVHAPEKPSYGETVAPVTETRRGATGNQAILKREEKIKRAATARAAVGKRPAPPHRGGLNASAAALSPFQLSRVASGQSVVVDGFTVAAGSPEMEQLRQVLRLQDAEKRGVA
jgi:hypothetical protein